jgi:hypothetical protein
LNGVKKKDKTQMKIQIIKYNFLKNQLLEQIILIMKMKKVLLKTLFQNILIKLQIKVISNFKKIPKILNNNMNKFKYK